MPALMKVTIAPMAYRMVVVNKMFMDVIHRLTFFFNICHKVALITCCPGHKSVLGLQFTKRRGSMGYDCIDGEQLVDGVELDSVINWCLVTPIYILIQWLIGLMLMMNALLSHPIVFARY